MFQRVQRWIFDRVIPRSALDWSVLTAPAPVVPTELAWWRAALADRPRPLNVLIVGDSLVESFFDV